MPGDRRLPPPVDLASLERAGLDYLSRFSASAERVRRVLLRRVKLAQYHHGGDGAAEAALVETLIGRWVRAGLIDDRLYAEARAAGLHRRGLPRRMISAKLKLDGIENEHIEVALDAEDLAAGDLAAAEAFLRRRRLGPWRDPETRAAAHLKDLAALARRGFERSVAECALSAATPEDLADLVQEMGDY